MIDILETLALLMIICFGVGLVLCLVLGPFTLFLIGVIKIL